MSTQPTLDPTTQNLSAGDLVDHPLLAHIPVWQRDEPDFQALLDSVRDRGLDYPVLIDSERRVIDGRNRRNVCSLLGKSVPCRLVADADAASIIVASLVNRRHLTKGAQAYLAAPLFEHVLTESKARRIANIKAGASDPALSAVTGRTLEDVALACGISLRLVEQAFEVIRRFAKSPEQKAQWEPEIIAGEIGLGAAIQAMAGQESTKGKAKINEKLEGLIMRGFRDLGTRFSKWGKLDDEARAELRVKVAQTTEQWPDDVVATTAAAWRKAGRI